MGAVPTDGSRPPGKISVYRPISCNQVPNMSTLPRVSIGLPVFNGEGYLAEALEALLGQTFEDFELVISDNASTDGTASICRRYEKQDPRIRYIRQPRNIGLNPNHNFVIKQARGELFKMASHDDLYAVDLLKRCVEVLDQSPEIVVCHSWEAMIDESGTVTKLLEYSVNASSPRAPERFRSLLLDGWDDYTYGVIRTKVLRRTHLHRSHHFADRTINTELALYGPFHLVPEWLYFRRDHPERKEPYTVRTRCAYLDPRRANRLRHPVMRLYAEYVWGYVAAVRRAPLPAAERRECYRYLAQWLTGRAAPVARRSMSGGALGSSFPLTAPKGLVRLDELVAGKSQTI